MASSKKIPEKGLFLDVSSFTYKEFNNLAEKKLSERQKEIELRSQPTWSSNDLKSITKLTFQEEFLAVCFFLFGVPGAAFTLPGLFCLAGYYTGQYLQTFLIALLILIPLAFWPIDFKDSTLYSWYALLIVKYFSFKAVYTERLPPETPLILVAPPHGVFPFGNITTMIAFPAIMGFAARALGASAAVHMPIFRQCLVSLGIIDAGRKHATEALQQNLAVGISSGGVAEVFETWSATGDEVIVLKSRKCIVKLAYSTGAAIVPCYVFGNTKLYRIFSGRRLGLHDWFKGISRRLGAAIIIFWGRFGLPIPFRVPIVSVLGKPIPVPKNANPTEQEIHDKLEELQTAMKELFDKHKAAYGWEHKNLIIE